MFYFVKQTFSEVLPEKEHSEHFKVRETTRIHSSRLSTEVDVN